MKNHRIRLTDEEIRIIRIALSYCLRIAIDWFETSKGMEKFKILKEIGFEDRDCDLLEKTCDRFIKWGKDRSFYTRKYYPRPRRQKEK